MLAHEVEAQAEVLTSRPYNRIPRWVRELAAGDCLALGDFQRLAGCGLSLQHGGKSYFVDCGDIVQVLEGGGEKRRKNRILCMTKEGPIPMSHWLVANWFAKL